MVLSAQVRISLVRCSLLLTRSTSACVAASHLHRYIDAYFGAIVPMSAEDGIEGLSFMSHTIWAGEEFVHLFPFRSKLVRESELAGLRNADMDELRERYEQWPYMKGTRAAIGVSADGLVGCSACGIVVQVGLIYCPHFRSSSTTCGTPTWA